MKYEFSVNGKVKLALQPENELEKNLLKTLGSQDNIFAEVAKGLPGGIYPEGTYIIGEEPGAKSKKETM